MKKMDALLTVSRPSSLGGLADSPTSKAIARWGDNCGGRFAWGYQAVSQFCDWPVHGSCFGKL